MQKLHLVGFTTDHEGLILSARRGTRSGGYLLLVDEAVAEAVEALLAQREDDESDAVDESTRAPRVESSLPVREIQARLRQGRTIADVAKAAGVDVAWVERFADPVLAERGQVIARVQRAALRRQRLGASLHPIGDAVRRSFSDRGVLLSPDEFRDAWTAKQIGEGRWAVRCTFHYRGKKKVLRFDLDEASGAVTAADPASSQFGYVTPPPAKRAGAKRSSAAGKPASRPTAKRSTSSSGYRREPTSGAAVSRSAKERQKAAAAMRKAAAKRAADAEKAAARRVRERAVEAARKERAAQVAAERAAREKGQRAQAAAVKKAAAAKKAAAKKKAVAKKKGAAKKKAVTKKKSVARKPAAKKGVTKKSVAKKPVAKKGVTKKKRVAKKPTVKKTGVKNSAVKGAVVKKPVVPRPVAPRPAATRVVSSTRAAPVTRPGPPSITPAPARPAPARPVPTSSAAHLVSTRPDPRRVPATPRPLGITEPRPLFRQGSAQPAIQERVAAAAPAPARNGVDESAPQRGPERPRRTRPLRAT